MLVVKCESQSLNESRHEQVLVVKCESQSVCESEMSRCLL